MATKVITATQATSLLRKASTGKVKLTPKQKTFLEKKAQALQEITWGKFNAAVTRHGYDYSDSPERRHWVFLSASGNVILHVKTKSHSEEDTEGLVVTSVYLWSSEAFDTSFTFTPHSFMKEVVPLLSKIEKVAVVKMQGDTELEKVFKPLRKVAKKVEQAY